MGQTPVRTAARGAGSARLGADRHRQALAALGATAAEDIATTGGLHAGTETVGTLPLDVAGLVGALHDELRRIRGRQGLRDRGAVQSDATEGTGVSPRRGPSRRDERTSGTSCWPRPVFDGHEGVKQAPGAHRRRARDPQLGPQDVDKCRSAPARDRSPHARGEAPPVYPLVVPPDPGVFSIDRRGSAAGR